jgi:hypothetical protein
MGSDLPMIGHGGTVPRVEGVQTLDLEEFIMEDTRFMRQHMMNMEVRFVLYIVWRMIDGDTRLVLYCTSWESIC